MSAPLLKKKDFILFLLNNIEPGKADLLRLNKVAFFVEFGFIYKNNQILSDAQYAALPKGPVIDEYKIILSEMEQAGDVKLDGNCIRPLRASQTELESSVELQLRQIISKYAPLTNEELIVLSHETDSYKITTENEKVTDGTRLIDKSLAHLEAFFEDVDCAQADEQDLVSDFDKADLVEYAG